MLAGPVALGTRIGISAAGPRAGRGPARTAHNHLVVSAFAHQHRHSYTERVLRYPDGVERRIIYPTADAAAAEAEDDVVVAGDFYRSFAEGLQPDRTVQTTEEPQDLFEQLSSASYRDTQREYWERIGSLYQVLDGCPWLLPKPLHVLAVAQLTAPHAAMFTVQTRVQQQQLESELSKVLGRQRADGSSMFSVDSLVEGIVAFEDEAAAETFGNALEAEGHQDVSLAIADSHELFRLTTSSAAAVVVLMKPGVEMPTPGELEVSLRRQRQDLLDT